MNISGFLLINKPKGISSFDCIRHIKKILNDRTIKIGHAGTLDPFATGLLIIALSREYTKRLSEFLTMPKTYCATAKLGELTDTLDCTGKLIQECPIDHITQAKLQKAIDSLTPEYVQTPPIISALKYQGEPLYALAKKNTISHEELQKIAEQKKRTVLIHAIELTKIDLPYFSIKTTVSHGTYIRTLMNDIAQKAHSCATTYILERTAIGNFTLEKAIPLEDIQTKEDIEKVILK